ncbi:MAG: hypothetical protein NVSMB66_6360 [Candidatus Doudnabacteria bacterium]
MPNQTKPLLSLILLASALLAGYIYHTTEANTLNQQVLFNAQFAVASFLDYQAVLERQITRRYELKACLSIHSNTTTMYFKPVESKECKIK